MVIVIIFCAVAVVVCCISWLGFILLRKKKNVTEVCAKIAGFWCVFELLLVIVFVSLLLSDINIYQYPAAAYILQSMFIESFICGAVIWCYGINRDTKELKDEMKKVLS